jgi:carboxymethylenebutenolidase
MTAVITLRGDRLAHEHISWDQGTVLRQLGLLPEWVAFPYPYPTGKEDSGKEELGTKVKKKVEVRLPVLGVETVVMLEGTLGKREREEGVNRLIDTPGVREL